MASSMLNVNDSFIIKFYKDKNLKNKNETIKQHY